MRNVRSSFLGGVLGVLLTSGLAWAQATAELSGRVTDQSGAILPGVTVTATQTDTSFTRTVVTDSTGTYVMPNLPTGPYRLEVSRLFPFSAAHGLEIRVEAFNLFNNFNWGNPVTNFNAATFGRILSQTGDPRIMQFGVKYAF